MDIRIGRYLSMVRELAAEFKKRAIYFAVRSRFGISLSEFYALDVAKRDFEILNTIKSVDMGAEFLIYSTLTMKSRCLSGLSRMAT